MSEAMTKLDGLGRTAWLTAYCHHATGERHGLKRPVSSWLIGRVGPPDFAGRIQPRTLHGVTLRARVMDDWLDDMLAQGAGKRPVTVLSLGAGFDSRWLGRLGSSAAIERWIEVDRPEVLAAKRDVLQASRFRAAYDLVEQRAGDLADDPGRLLSGLGGPVVVIAEGVLDYLAQPDRDRVLTVLRDTLALCGMLVDAQNALFQRLANWKAEANTGSDAIRFAWAPRNPIAYLRGHGFAVTRTYSPLPDLCPISSTAAEKLAVSLIPSIRDGYRILWIS